MNGLLQDLRYALRQLRKTPGFAAVAVITLALGIGANTAIFSVVNGVLLRPLPLKDPDRLVRIWHTPPVKSFPGIPIFAVSAANYLDWEKQNQVFERMAIYTFQGLTLTGSDKPEQVDTCAASSGFFETLGVPPMLGHTFTPEEDQQGRSDVVVLSYRFWEQHFGSNRDIVGHNITMDGRQFLVAGVMPPSFRFPDFAQMWKPMGWTDQERIVRGEHHYMVVGRLKPTVSIKQAQADLSTISSRLEQLYPADDKGWGATVLPLHDDLVSDVRPALLVLLGAVAFVLLIACSNVANLALAKTFSRQKEIAIRTALGASSRRVLRQILTETVVLAFAGGLLGLIFAHFGVQLIMAFLGDKLPKSIEVGLDPQVLVFTAVVALVTGILAGVLPALRLTRSNVSQSLKEGLGRTDTDSGGHSTRSVLVVAEVALSLVLLIGAGLMIHSFQRLQSVAPGFDSHGVLTMTASVSESKFPTPEQQVSFFERVLQRTRGLPGVEAAGVIDSIPLMGGSHQPVQIEGRPVVAMADQPEVDVRLISAGFMRAMHVPVLRGRDFGDEDVAGRPATILISESMAKNFWPGEDAIGKHATLSFSPERVREVVGIVRDVKLDGLDQSRPPTVIYLPLDQIYAPSFGGGWRSFPMTLVVRSTTSPASMVSAVLNAITETEHDIPIRDIATMENVVTNSLSQQKLNMLLLGAFAGLALLLAAIGIYSVLSYSVRRRVQEIGIRVALGASLTDVLRLVLVEGMKPTLLGMGIGVAAALGLGRVVSSLIYGVKASDPVSFLVMAAILTAIAFVACIIPAYRATKVDPMVALRYE